MAAKATFPFRLTLAFASEEEMGDFREHWVRWHKVDRSLRLDPNGPGLEGLTRRAVEAGGEAAGALRSIGELREGRRVIDWEQPYCGCCHHYATVECDRGECSDGSRCASCDED